MELQARINVQEIETVLKLHIERESGHVVRSLAFQVDCRSVHGECDGATFTGVAATLGPRLQPPTGAAPVG